MVKVISLSEEAYKLLKKMKRNGMSFSEVIVENLINKEKTEDIQDMIAWIKTLKSGKKKEKIDIDKIVYGVKR